MPEKPRVRCFDIEVDGKPVRVRGDPNMSEDSRAALVELIRAASRRLVLNRDDTLNVDASTPPTFAELAARPDTIVEEFDGHLLARKRIEYCPVCGLGNLASVVHTRCASTGYEGL
jgi:formate dehydrogenase maturation protein FdhE